MIIVESYTLILDRSKRLTRTRARSPFCRHHYSG
ncbi:Uncharacterised protein [Vibrio cholerae]|nr:Uncharacterised protein [Vibrio cholerae]